MAEAKTSQAVLHQVKSSYLAGEFKSIRELADQYSLNPKTLQSRIVRESWLEQRESKLREIESKMVKRVVNVGEEYLLNTFKRAKRYESIIDKALDQACDLVDPEQLNQLSLVEARTHALAKSALRIADVSSVDVTSKGQSLGESWVSAIQKLRDSEQSEPKLGEKELGKILEAEIVDESEL